MRRVNFFLFRFDFYEFWRSVFKMLNFVFVVFGKDYKMRIFKFKLVLYFDIKIEMIDKDYV